MAPFSFKKPSKMFGQGTTNTQGQQQQPSYAAGASAPPSFDPYAPSAPQAPAAASAPYASFVPPTASYGASATAPTAPYASASAPSYGASAPPSTTTPPKKYTKINGVTKLNPEYKRWKEAQGNGPATTAIYPDQSLPVVTNMEDHALMNEANVAAGLKEVPLAESTAATIEIMQEPEITAEAGMQPDEMVDELGAILNKYEVPMGLMNKLIMLTEYEVLEFMVDDSGSMSMVSDTVDSNHRPQTRWQEAQSRLKSMIEIVAYVPFNRIAICFLNRPERVELTRMGRPPRVFLQDAYQQIDRVFQRGPTGSTPVLEKMKESLARGQGKNVSRYLFCDGQPNGGNPAKAEIVSLLLRRPNPQGNPITFLSCTGDDAQVEWMKDAEEVIPYAAECDDFRDEADEVHKDQGTALPFTIGFYLICSLVAAMNPDDLDAMDESVPFTKTTLDNLLGIQSDEPTYRHYFDCFLQAQRVRPIEMDDYGRPKRTDQIKKDANWQALYQDFLRAPLASQIPAVQAFKRQLQQ